MPTQSSPESRARSAREIEFTLTRWRGEVVAPEETRIEVRVRYAETDAMGIVYHANHLVWYEMGRVDWLDRLGLPYREIEARGVSLPVVELACRYLAPARFDERLTLATRLVGTTRARARFGYRLLGPDGLLLAEAYSDHGVVDRAMHPIRLPDWFRERLPSSIPRPSP